MNAVYLRQLTLLLALVGLAGCTTYQPRIDYDRNASFTGLTRYAWVPAESEQGYQSLDQTRIRRALEDGLAARGLAPAALDQAQVWVDVDYSIDRRFEARTTYYGYYHWHPYWWGMEPDRYLQERDESRLALLMIDPATRSVIWAGQITLRYYQEMVPAERDASLKQQVDAILARFPPP